MVESEEIQISTESANDSNENGVSINIIEDEQSSTVKDFFVEDKISSHDSTDSTDTSDLFSKLKNTVGSEFDLDEDYVKTDYRTKAKTLEQEIEKLSSSKISDEASALNDFIIKGGNALDFFKAQLIDKDNISEEEKILSYLKRTFPNYDDEMIEFISENEYGVGEDIEDIKDFNRERYFNVKIKRTNALDAEDKYLDESKIQLTNSNNKEAQPTTEEYAKMVSDFQGTLIKDTSVNNELLIGDTKFNVSGIDNIIQNHIPYEKNGITYLNDIPASEAALMIALWKNKDSVFDKIRKEANVKAEIMADSIYNNSKSLEERSSSQGKSKWDITVK